MQIAIDRFSINETTTISTITLDNGVQYFGLEPCDFSFTGTFNLVAYLSPAFKRNVPLFQGIPGHSGIEVHIGNTVKDSTGCFCIGMSNPDEYTIADSGDAVEAFYGTFFDAVNGGDTVTVTVTNSYADTPIDEVYANKTLIVGGIAVAVAAAVGFSLYN
jgi:hypothetical protein